MSSFDEAAKISILFFWPIIDFPPELDLSSPLLPYFIHSKYTDDIFSQNFIEFRIDRKYKLGKKGFVGSK